MNVPTLLIVEAAIQGLHTLVQKKDAEIEENRAVINELLSRQAVIENQLAALTERLEDLATTH